MRRALGEINEVYDDVDKAKKAKSMMTSAVAIENVAHQASGKLREWQIEKTANGVSRQQLRARASLFRRRRLPNTRAHKFIRLTTNRAQPMVRFFCAGRCQRFTGAYIVRRWPRLVAKCIRCGCRAYPRQGRFYLPIRTS